MTNESWLLDQYFHQTDILVNLSVTSHLCISTSSLTWSPSAVSRSSAYQGKVSSYLKSIHQTRLDWLYSRYECIPSALGSPIGFREKANWDSSFPYGVSFVGRFFEKLDFHWLSLTNGVFMRTVVRWSNLSAWNYPLKISSSPVNRFRGESSPSYSSPHVKLSLKTRFTLVIDPPIQFWGEWCSDSNLQRRNTTRRSLFERLILISFLHLTVDLVKDTPGQSSIIGLCGSRRKTTYFSYPNSVNFPLSKNTVIRYFHTNTHFRTDTWIDNRKR